jgi:hypothetical protein
MRDQDKWIEEKLKNYKENPIETLVDLLQNTTDVIEQYRKAPNSLACKGLLQNAEQCNQRFLGLIDKLVIRAL